jgi:hypothetical protein
VSGKQGGLAQKLLVGGYDISGNAQALDTVHGGPALGDFTTIDQVAHAREGLQRDGGASVATLMDPALAHPVLAALPTADEQVMYMLNPLAVGSPVACCIAKQIDYDQNRAANGMLTQKTQFDSNAFGLEWCVALTAGVRSDTGAANGASLDQGGGFSAPAVPATTVPVTNTSPLPATVVVTGGTVTSVAVNGVSVGTGDGTYTVPSGQAIALTYSAAPTWTWTLQTAFGAQAYLQVTQVTGTSVTVTVQHSPDNSTWSTLAAFAAVSAAPATQRLAASGTVGRYLRAISTGTFSAASFAVSVAVNPVAVSF